MHAHRFIKQSTNPECKLRKLKAETHLRAVGTTWVPAAEQCRAVERSNISRVSNEHHPQETMLPATLETQQSAATTTSLEKRCFRQGRMPRNTRESKASTTSLENRCFRQGTNPRSTRMHGKRLLWRTMLLASNKP
jgi:hypothetical protein